LVVTIISVIGPVGPPNIDSCRFCSISGNNKVNSLKFFIKGLVLRINIKSIIAYKLRSKIIMNILINNLKVKIISFLDYYLPDIFTAWLTGSYVDQNFNEESDIDLWVLSYKRVMFFMKLLFGII
jgi:predicted nucleotidyltransferase